MTNLKDIIRVFFALGNPEMFCKKGVLRNFTKFTVNAPVLESLFAFRPLTLLKRDSNKGIFL